MTSSEAARRRKRANTTALVVAILVFAGAIAALFLGLPSALAAEKAAGEPTRVSVSTGPSTTTTRETGGTAPGKDTVEESSGSVETTTTGPAADRSLLGRAFENPATFWILQFLLALLAGFLAGAAAQRIYLGHYGLKIGQLELDPIPEVTTEAAKAAADLIRVQDVPQRVNAGITQAAPRWWVDPPKDEADARATLILAGIALEAGVRELALRADLTDYPQFSPTVAGLVGQKRFAKGFGDGLVTLVALRDRLIAGAQLGEGAELALKGAYGHAVRVLERLD